MFFKFVRKHDNKSPELYDRAAALRKHDNQSPEMYDRAVADAKAEQNQAITKSDELSIFVV